ncbi:betaine--homocysteine S-methyltransferase 1-like isoform X1 [Montipora capricornis]|uniref:betaine--homocysteine S-methyltransferase 1-like isoform X1 n=2 Tax=Montipora capricornis TaxID=246305 RepID=UPI0035F195E1
MDGIKQAGFLKRLNEGEIIVGDGGMSYCLEKRGYVKAGPWTPECTVENPEAVRQLHREFLRAGADVIQAYTFSYDDDLDGDHAKYGTTKINQAACDLAKGVAKEGGALFAGCICQTASLYSSGAGKEVVSKKFREEVEIFLQNDADLLIAEFFSCLEEAEWAVEVMKSTGKPIAMTMCIGPLGDRNGVSPGECAVGLAKAGANIIGVNCRFGPNEALQTICLMKEALEKADLKVHLMVQPVCYHTPDAGPKGWVNLPEAPFALEPRLLTRWDVHKYARQAYDLGVRYIGGCCGFEPYHIRAIAEELAHERGKLPIASEKHGLWGEALKNHGTTEVKARASRAYWENLKPASGRPFCPALSGETHPGPLQ